MVAHNCGCAEHTETQVDKVMRLIREAYSLYNMLSPEDKAVAEELISKLEENIA